MAPEVGGLPSLYDPQEKPDCRKLINHIREKSQGPNEQMASLKGVEHLRVKEKGSALIFPGDRRESNRRHEQTRLQ